MVAVLFFLLLHFHSLSSSSAQQTAELRNFTASVSPWRAADNRILVSPNRNFSAGFRRSNDGFVFSVWLPLPTGDTVVWSLKNISIPGISVSSNGTVISAVGNSTLLLLNDDGSLVNGRWTSFDYPTDTILANQNLPSNGTERLRSASGKYALVNATTLVYVDSGEAYWSTNGNAAIRNLTSDGTLHVDGNDNNYIAADFGDATVLRRLVLDDSGNLRLYSLSSGDNRRWTVTWQAVQELCTIRGMCGAGAICMPRDANTSCVCPPGYNNSSAGANVGGCVIKTNYGGAGAGEFLRLDFVQFRWSSGSVDLSPADIRFCQSKCLSNVTCKAYAYKFDGSRNCTHLTGDLTEAYWSPVAEISTFVRVALSASSSPNNFTGMVSRIDTVCPALISLPVPPKESRTTARNIAIIVALFSLELFIGAFSFRAFLKKYSKYRDMARTLGLEFLPGGGPKRFSYGELKAATNDFSNVVGQGGFGMVYKGELSDGRVVAVKRLKHVMRRAEADFWAEVTIIARMHHLNLVRMWGFCADKGHRMLVYEYVPNGSLDKYLFSSGDAGGVPPALDWSMRYRIAVGVARAIAYLHEECLQWVLHCDIKPENILLGDDYCPKVSDFGLSKLANKEDKVSMSHIRGTRGYLAPEWVTKSEPISAKADVFSFGMVLLEIVSGVRNFEFQRASLESIDWYFPRWAYEKVYVEKKVEELIDKKLMGSYDNREHAAMVERMVKTAMWCLQDRAEMRPTMGKVAKMLEGTVEITEPEKPTIFYLNEGS